MAKTVRLYFSTFIDIEVDENDFNDEDARMIEYAKENASDYITLQDLYDNLSEDPTGAEVIDEL